MRAIRVSRTLRRWFAAAVSMAVLASCAQDTTPPSPDPPADAPTALVYGMAMSPIYEALKSKVRMTVSNGSQKATDFDLVILDGDAFTAQQLREEELVHSAIRGGVWVLGLDMAEDDKQHGLGYLLEAGTGSVSEAYLTRKTLTTAHHRSVRMIEFRHEGSDTGASQAERIVQYLKEPDLAVQQTIDVPDDLIHATFTFTEDHSVNMPGINTFTDPPGRPQTAQWTVDHAVKVFLENSNTPQGDFQWVLVETTGSGNPGSLAVNKADEIGWYQTKFVNELQFGDGSNKPIPDLTLIKSEPQNANNVQTVTTNVSFSIGFNQAQGGLGSFGYSNATTKTITDWKVRNNSASNVANFQFGSNNPTDGFIEESSEDHDKGGLEIDSSAFSDCFLCSRLPLQPNTLSTSNMEYFTQALYQSDKVINDTVSLEVLQYAIWTDAWCYGFQDGDYDCYTSLAGSDFTRLSRKSFNPGPNNAPMGLYAVNLGVVVPISIKSLTFSPNPVVAGQTTTGTLTLEKAAETDIMLDLSSDSQFATPTQNKYIIHKGQDHIDFSVETGQDGTGKDFSAKFTAFYAEGQNAILEINQPSSGN